MKTLISNKKIAHFLPLRTGRDAITLAMIVGGFYIVTLLLMFIFQLSHIKVRFIYVGCLSGVFYNIFTMVAVSGRISNNNRNYLENKIVAAGYEFSQEDKLNRIYRPRTSFWKHWESDCIILTQMDNGDQEITFPLAMIRRLR